MNRLITALLPLLLLAAPARASGLATAERGPLRTAYTRAHVVVDGDVATTEVVQVFVNDLDAPAEVTYSFPLPEDAAVTGFADWRDGRRVDARVEGKEDASDEYEAAAAEGRTAALAEKESRNRFRMRLSTVPPHGTRRVALRYVQTLSALGGERTYVFPSAGDGEASPPTVLDVDVEIRPTRRLLGVRSLNHADARVARREDEGAGIHLSRTGTGLGHDLAVRWREESTPIDLAARSVRTHADQPGYVEARLAFNEDPLGHLRPPRDVVLVVDRSLSMAGAPLERARTLSEGVLAELMPGDRFGLVTFNEVAVQTFEHLVPAEDEALMRAFADLADLRAGGRSNLGAALDAAGDLLMDGRDGLVVLVTDGQPTTGAGFTPVSLDVAPAYWEGHRVVVAHTSYPSRAPALEALFPEVTVRYVPDGPAGAEVVEDVIRLAVAPTLDDLDVRIAGADVSAVHGDVPERLAVGEHVRLLGRAGSTATVLVTGRLHGRPILLDEAVVMPEGPDGSGGRGLPVEWARARVADLGRRLDAGAEGVDAEALEAEIRSLGEAHGLATRFTSYVLTDRLAPDRIKPGDPEIRIRAPRSADAVRAVLPWGEVVECRWQEDEGLWLGRFLVPRGTADGMYRMRVFVDRQGTTELRGTLFFRVDSAAPEFELLRAESEEVRPGDRIKLFARPKDAVYEGDVVAVRGDTVVRDRVDLKRIVVQVGDREVPLEQVGEGEIWETAVRVDLPPGTHTLRLVATDYATNSSVATLTLEVTE
ncbi:MAG: VIT domain-containing protein [Myxococcota bacterium]